MATVIPGDLDGDVTADWHRRVVGRSLRTAAARSVDRGRTLVKAAMTVLDRSDGDDITVQEVADEAGQSLRTLYQYFESKDDLLLAVFEEAMRTYARMIERAIADLTDPLERLAGGLLAAARMPEFSGTGVDRGLTRVRLRLSEAQPELVGRAQSVVTTLVRQLVEAAAEAGAVTVPDSEAATFMLRSLTTAFITTETLGNDLDVRRPDAATLTLFSLRGLGAEVDDEWLAGVGARLRLPSRRAAARSSRSTRPAAGQRKPRARTAKR